MRFHMDLIREHAASAYGETLEATTAVQVFGTPDDVLLGDGYLPGRQVGLCARKR